MRGDMAQACAYIKNDFSKKGDRKLYDEAPITFLTKTDADKVDEPAAKITQEEFIKLTLGEMIKMTFPNWDKPINPEWSKKFFENFRKKNLRVY